PASPANPPAPAPDPAPPRAPERRIRVGTWNIEQFGSRTRGHRTDEDVERIAAFIRDELRVDLLAVQEVNGAEPLARLCRALGSDYTFIIGSSGAFRDSDRRISLGFLWNRRRLRLLGAEELIDLPDTDPNGIYIFHRKPVMACFRSVDGGLDFRAIVVHLKAGRRDRGRRGERDSKKRQAEVRLLGERIGALLARPGEDQDLLVLGDFNHDPSYPAHALFRRWVEYLRPAHHHRSIVHFDEQIDHIAIAPGLREEVLRDTFRIHSRLADASPSAWRHAYSDHIPLTVDLSSERDNDPEATFAPPAPERVLEPGKEAPPERFRPR
ncbi:MAG: hypothetical protein D6731_21760, partial [Planctomycetota bacterium]